MKEASKIPLGDIKTIACPSCTFKNPKGFRSCEVCGRNLMKQVINIKQTNALTKEGWACPACSLVNEYEKLRCTLCERLRPKLIDFPSPQVSTKHAEHKLNLGIQMGSYSTGRFSGLTNIGNTCWMNASLQALYSCDAFANIFLSENLPITRSDNTDLFKEIVKLFCQCRDSNPGPVTPTGFKKALSFKLPQYNNNNQHDSATFIMLILDELFTIVEYPANTTLRLNWSDTLFPSNRTIPPSIIRDVCGLKEKVIKTYYPCSHTVTLSTIFNCVLLLPIPNKSSPTTLLDCLNNYAFREKENDKGRCKRCNIETNSNDILTQLMNAPEMLIMNIKRYSIINGKAQKNQTPISIPLILEDLGYLSTEETYKYWYQLTGVVHHAGTLTSGHYTANVRMNNGTWLYCNDSSITINTDFEKDIKEQTNDFKAVVLVYSRINKVPEGGGKYGNTTKRRRVCQTRRIKKQNRS